MADSRKIVLGCSLVAALGAVGCWYGLSSLWDDGMCGNSPTYTAVSPDGLLKAVVFERDCGATTGFSMQVSILNARDGLPNKAGNVFIDGDNTPVTAAWTGPRNLTVRYDPQVKVYVKKLKSEIRTGALSQGLVFVRYDTLAAVREKSAASARVPRTTTRIMPAGKRVPAR